MTADGRAALIARYAEGPALLRKTLARVPTEMMQWRPAPGKWSVHEIIVHCADSECNAHMRIRYLVAEATPVIVGYDQDNWARVFDYHSHPIEPALATVEAVRANTLPLLHRLTEADWQKAGTHTESGRYTSTNWLHSYGEHLEVHSRQIERNMSAWEKR